MLTNKEIIELCISEIWEAVHTPDYLTEYQEYQLARCLQRTHRHFLCKLREKPRPFEIPSSGTH
jgi:hypothetical protein